MATEVIIPSLGEVVKDVKILRWFKSEGDAVEKGEPLLEVESEKVTVEIEAPASGILGRILCPEGSRVSVTQTVGVLLQEGEALPEGREAPVQAGSQPGEGATQDVRAAPVARKLAEQHGIDLSLVTPTGPHGTIMKKDVMAYLSSREEAPGRVKVSPLARAVAGAEGVNLAGLQGTGTGGRIVKEDVLRKLREKEAPVEGPGAGRHPADAAFEGKEALETLPMTGTRLIIAENMALSLSRSAQLTLHTEGCAEGLIALRERLNGRIGGERPRVSYNAVLVKIAATALRRHPRVNASVEGDQIKVWRQVHIGVAMESGDNLLVPVVRNADLKTILEINGDLEALVQRTRENRLLPDDLAGGTFTLSNLGFAGVDFFTPILRPPESGLLGVGRIIERPVVRDGRVQPEKRIGLSLTFDHRVIDGAPAARFLQTVREMIEDPFLLIT